jgi:hypothetical protein
VDDRAVRQVHAAAWAVIRRPRGPRGLALRRCRRVDHDRRGGFDASPEALEPGERVVERGSELSDEVFREIEARATRDHETPEEAIAGEPLVHLLETLLQTHPGGGAIVE